jgi:hypothetical protein
MNVPKPIALGYACGPAGVELQRQFVTITAYAAVEGLTLADVLHDESDACTISQLVQAARQHDAAHVILPPGFASQTLAPGSSATWLSITRPASSWRQMTATSPRPSRMHLSDRVRQE